MTDVNGHSPSQLKFEIVCTKTVDNPNKHVVYTVKVSKESTSLENNPPGLVDRRYTEFLDLYTKLYQEFPAIFSSLAFPKKAMVGNFSPETISLRSAGFESLLTLIGSNDKVRESVAVIDFFQQKELSESLKLIQNQNYNEAIFLLENSFHLLNNLLTPRHPRVLRQLCLLVACCHAAGAQQTRHFATTAVKRFGAVSDTDILRYYVPLLQLCVGLLQNADKELLQERLSSMKRRGMKVDGCPGLLEAVLADL